MNRTESSTQAAAIESLPQLLRLPAVLQATGLARSTVYRMVAEHTFPAPVKLAKRAVGWRPVDSHPFRYRCLSWPGHLASE